MNDKKIIIESARPTSNLDTRSASPTSAGTFDGGNVGGSVQPTSAPLPTGSNSSRPSSGNRK